jgi:formate hydrogenlyase subunit 6/NADH:ubiquinone oxidoreductase subunit I
LKLERYGIGIVKGLAVVIRNFFRFPVTVLYPEQKLNTSRRIRGNELVWNRTKCIICTTCAKACPQGAIHLVTAVDPANPNKNTVAKIEVDTGYCIMCGLCVEACPYNAIFMGYAYERAKYRRQDLVQTNEGLLASPERRASAFLHPELEAGLPEQTLLIDKKLHREEKVKVKTPNPPAESTGDSGTGGSTTREPAGKSQAAKEPAAKDSAASAAVPPAKAPEPEKKPESELKNQ